ncbi:MAG: hypothetical protein AB7K63_12035 [Vicinamibacterales bacterium]
MRLIHTRALGVVALVAALAAATMTGGAQNAPPTEAERAAARLAANPSGSEVISGVLRQGMVGQTPYEAIKPPSWNGTLVLDHDFVSDTWGATQRRWFLERGYAIGGPNRQQDASAYEMRNHVENFLTIRRLFIERFGTPKRTIAFGVSRAGFPALSAIDMHPEIFDGAVAMSGGGHGVVGTLLSKLDAVWALEMLVDPASPLTLVDLPEPGEGRYPPDAAFNAIVEKAKATPLGRARLVLAGAFDQAPVWSIRDSAQPAATDYDAQVDNMVASFAGGFPHRIRYLNEAMAGGNFTWNHGVDYRAQLERSGLIDVVRHAYAKAGANLDADLDTLAKAPRVSADPAAVARAERNGGYTGKLRGPVLLAKTIGDPYDPPSAEMAYEDLVRKAGTEDLVRTVYINRPGHATQTVLEKVAAFQTLVDRLESGRWMDARQLPERMNATAAELRPTLAQDFGEPKFVFHRPAMAIRTWDFTNWGTYSPR